MYYSHYVVNKSNILTIARIEGEPNSSPQPFGTGAFIGGSVKTYIVQVNEDPKILTDNVAQAMYWVMEYTKRGQRPVLKIVGK